MQVELGRLWFLATTRLGLRVGGLSTIGCPAFRPSTPRRSTFVAEAIEPASEDRRVDQNPPRDLDDSGKLASLDSSVDRLRRGTEERRNFLDGQVSR